MSLIKLILKRLNNGDVMTTFTSWDSELCHHGIKGQKWGIRRFQNPDGTYTEEGLRRRGKKDFFKEVKNASKVARKERGATSSSEAIRSNPKVKEAAEKLRRYSDEANEAKQEYFDTVTRRRAAAAKTFERKFGRAPESETELARVDSRILSSANLNDSLNNRYMQRSQKYARKILGWRGSRKVYSNFAQNERHYETARSVVAKTLRDLADEEYKKKRTTGNIDFVTRLVNS